MYKIGELSKLCRIPVKTLRYYDEEGLLIPDRVDSFTGYRYYLPGRLKDCYRILALKELGFSISEIRSQFNATPTELEMMMNQKISELKNERDRLLACIKLITSLKEHLKEESGIMNHVIVRESDSFRIAGVRKLYQTKAKVYQKLKEIKEKIPETSLGKRMVIINFEIEYQPSDLDLFAGVEVMNYQDIYPETEIAFSEKTAAVIVEEKLVEEGYDDLYRYLNENNWQITGPFYEIYYEDGTVEIKVPVVALYHEDIAKNESLDIPFENDPEAIGKWEYYDSFPSIEQFSAEKTKNSSPTWLKELYMLPGGKRYWILGWTKGSLLLSVGYPDRTFCCNYEIRSINKDRYMFVSNKVNDTYFRGGKPNIMVFKKIDSKEYTLTDIRIKDPIDFPFETDPIVLGSWKSCDFVDSIESFDCFHPMYPADRHYLLGIRFEEGGKCIKCFRNSKLPNYTMDWTLGLIINRKSELSERYEIRTINGRDYLFTEWKSGDYTFGGRKPGFYVLERE